MPGEEAHAHLVDAPQPRPLAAGLILVALSLALFFSNLGAHDLWGPDEVRYALVAREMLETSNYVVPHLNGDTYLEKPPLMFWLSALVAKATGGPSEFSPRLPSAIAALLTVLLTWRLAARRWDEWTGLVAGIVLATNAQFFWFGRSGSLDTLLTFWCTLAIVCGVYALESERIWTVWVPAIALALGAGVLTKGPVAFLVPVLTLAFYGWSLHRGRRAAVLIGTGMVLAVVLVLPWWRAAHAGSGGEYGSASELTRQTWGRLFLSYSHRKPFYHYAVGIFGEFLPWALFLPAAVWSAWRARGTVEWPRLRLAWFWAVPSFLAFSAISGKRGQYLLPLYPGLAILVAAYWRQHATNLAPLRRVKSLLVPSMLLTGAMFVAGAAMMLAPWLAIVKAQGLGYLARPALAGGLATLCLAIWSLLHHLDRPPSRVFATIAVVTTLLFGFVAGVILPLGDHFKSARPFAAELRSRAGVSTPVYLFHSFRPDIAYYFGRHLEVIWGPQRISEYAGVATPMLAIMEEDIYKKLGRAVPDQFVVVHRARIGSRIWLLLSNEPPVI